MSWPSANMENEYNLVMRKIRRCEKKNNNWNTHNMNSKATQQETSSLFWVLSVLVSPAYFIIGHTHVLSTLSFAFVLFVLRTLHVFFLKNHTF